MEGIKEVSPYDLDEMVYVSSFTIKNFDGDIIGNYGYV
jgi:hypothetical protein